MIEEVLKTIRGVEIYPLISLFLFLVGFVMVLAATWRMKTAEVEYASRLPLDDGVATGLAGDQADTDVSAERTAR